MNANLQRSLILAFSVSAALLTTGCATTQPPETRMDDCMKKSGPRLRLPFVELSYRTDKFDEQCAVARFGVMVAGMNTNAGKPDMNNYLVALNLYQESTPEAKAFMDKMLKQERNMTMADIKFALKSANGDMDCDIVETTLADGTVTTGARCKAITAPAANALPAFKK